MKFGNTFLVYAIVFALSVVLVRLVDYSILNIVLFWIATPVAVLVPYVVTGHIFHAVFRRQTSPLWLGVPVVMVLAFLGWAAQLTHYSNAVLAQSKRVHDELPLDRSETCLEFASPVYDRFRSDFTRYLLLSRDLREVSRDAPAPSAGCLLVRKFEDVEVSEGKYEFMFSIQAVGENGKVETIGQIHWGNVSYPFFPPVFDPSAYSKFSGSAGGARWFKKTSSSFMGANVYPAGYGFDDRLNYLLAAEFARIMGRKVGPYVRGW